MLKKNRLIVAFKPIESQLIHHIRFSSQCTCPESEQKLTRNV